MFGIIGRPRACAGGFASAPQNRLTRKGTGDPKAPVSVVTQIHQELSPSRGRVPSARSAGSSLSCRLLGRPA
jgi:hypothetical protein